MELGIFAYKMNEFGRDPQHADVSTAPSSDTMLWLEADPRWLNTQQLFIMDRPSDPEHSECYNSITSPFFSSIIDPKLVLTI